MQYVHVRAVLCNAIFAVRAPCSYKRTESGGGRAQIECACTVKIAVAAPAATGWWYP